MRLRPADVVVDEATLFEYPLPKVSAETSKSERGTVVVVGGTSETPGAMVLAGIGALRCGAGKLQIITVADVAAAVGAAVPEARVIGLPSHAREVDPSALADCADTLQKADALVVGPGTMDPERAGKLAVEVVDRLGPQTRLVLDAAALAIFEMCADVIAPVGDRTIAMPNTAEAGHLLGVEPGAIADDLGAALDDLVARLRVFVTLRDATTCTGGPGTPRFVDHSGHPALATSGSGDVLAGMLAGLAARGAAPLNAMLWGAHAHGQAGLQAAQRLGGIGVLAREVTDLIPSVLGALSRT